jgi:predicted hydrocarbon binding protein
MRVSGLDPIHPIYCHDLRGSFHAALSACGAKNLQVVHTECVLEGKPDCVFDARF